ncbi:MAG: ATP-binding protein [Acidobacteriota bacterium]
MNYHDLQVLVAGGESEILELKKTTGQISKAGKTLCGFLNCRGGTLLFGVEPDGRIAGQIVADTTLRDIAALLQAFEPQPPVSMYRVRLPDSSLEVIVLQVDLRTDLLPFTYDGRAYERIGTTTSPMSQQRYQELLINRLHSRSRWENQRAEGFTLEDLDEEEIRRTARLGISSGRMPEFTGFDALEVLDRFGLRADGCLLNAALVVYGKRLFARSPGDPGCPYGASCGSNHPRRSCSSEETGPYRLWRTRAKCQLLAEQHTLVPVMTCCSLFFHRAIHRANRFGVVLTPYSAR